MTEELPTYVLERTFDAPRELVWRTWTEPELVKRWYGPNVETVIHELDARAGGRWLTEMKMGDKSSYQAAEYLEVVAPERLVWLHKNTDEAWNLAPSPMSPDWPRVLHTTVTFEEAEGKTAMRLVWVPHEPTEAEIAFFAGALAGLDRGWGMGMQILEELLAELQA